MARLIDYTGQKIGKLTVVERVDGKKYSNARWLCQCECGNHVIVPSNEIKKRYACPKCNRTTSSEKLKRHGETRTRLFRTWTHMRQRCINPNDRAYSRYGGRGISVCDEWQKYENFRDWALSHGYDSALTLDRIDNNGNYEPLNCRWATNKEQCNNRRTNRIVTIDGITKNLKQWADFLGIPSYVIRTRLHRGYGEQEAITTPVRTNINGNYVTINYYELAKKRLDAAEAQQNIFDYIGG